MADQTLLVTGVVWRGSGFASQIGCQNPGEHSLKLGTPGLYYGRPLAFKTRMLVCYASLNNARTAYSEELMICYSGDSENAEKGCGLGALWVCVEGDRLGICKVSFFQRNGEQRNGEF